MSCCYFHKTCSKERIGYLLQKYDNLQIEIYRLPAIIKAETCETTMMEILYNKIRRRYKQLGGLIARLRDIDANLVVINSTHLSWTIPQLRKMDIVHMSMYGNK